MNLHLIVFLIFKGLITDDSLAKLPKPQDAAGDAAEPGLPQTLVRIPTQQLEDAQKAGAT